MVRTPPNDAGPAGTQASSLERLAARRRVVSLCLAGAALVGFLAADSLRYTVKASGSDIVIEAFGHRVSAPAFEPGAPVKVSLRPQERYSSPQVLVRDHGPAVNGLRFLAAVLIPHRRNPTRFPEFLQKDGESARYVQFNPFRASFVVHQGSRDLRLEVNVPDASLELWRDGEKVSAESLKPPWLQLTFALLLAALAASVLVGALLPTAGRPEEAPEDAAAEPPRPSRVALVALFAFGFAATLFFSGKVFHHLPGFGDEMNYLFQAKIFASGHLSVPEPPDPEFFKVDWMHLFENDGKVWGFHPPGSCLFLMFGWLFGVYWITLPIVAGLLLSVQYLLALEVLGDRRWAFLGAALVGTSHWVLALASSFMAHAPSILLLSLFVLSVFRFLRTERPRTLLWAAFWLGLAFLVRPISAALVGLPFLLLLLARWKRRLLSAYVVAAAVGAAVGSLQFWYTFAITGRFTFPYAIKGMEVGQTLLVRLSKGWDVHLTNLFRNFNELGHRVHSFGILLNVLFFFVPLTVMRPGRQRRNVLFMAGIVLFYAIAHSFLHWYGWKWEPRMLSDVSFLFFLVSTAGLMAIAQRRQILATTLTVALAAALVWVAVVDLPSRSRTEYHNYNDAPSGVAFELREKKIDRGVVFFATEQPYSVYMAMNSATFDGPLVFARQLGHAYDYKLLSRFPDRPAFLSMNGQAIVPRPNFYRLDAGTLAKDLQAYAGDDVSIVLPWKTVATPRQNDALRGAKMSPGEFLVSLTKPPEKGRRRVAVFVEDATELARLIDRLYETETPRTSSYEGPIAFRVLTRRREGVTGHPGFWMTCTEGTRWEGPVIRSGLVTSLDLGPCMGENRSIQWTARFDVKTERLVTFSLESDDGSGLLIDDTIVIDNDLENSHGPLTKHALVMLKPGPHTLRVKYFNGPDGEKLALNVTDAHGVEAPLSVTTFMDEFYFYVDPLPAAVEK